MAPVRSDGGIEMLTNDILATLMIISTALSIVVAVMIAANWKKE